MSNSRKQTKDKDNDMEMKEKDPKNVEQNTKKNKLSLVTLAQDNANAKIEIIWY